MAYTCIAECVRDLAKIGDLREVSVPVDENLEVAALQRRLYQAGAPAVLLTGGRFPILLNLFGTLRRARYVLRHGLRAVEHAMLARVNPLQGWRLLPRLHHLLPLPARSAPVLQHEIKLSQLPQQVSWPKDGGPFVTLPLVYSEDPARPGVLRSNLGMYRIQLAGNHYEPDREAGLHYQLHRGIGNHHHSALQAGKDLYVNVFVGGPPSLTLSAVMPLPEGMPELALAGLLGGRSIRIAKDPATPLRVLADADFCIMGRVKPGVLKPEGPFGDHLGYYSLKHDYPVLEVLKVTHRPHAVWPLTSVGRPPQEDTVFGELIHELTGPVLPAVLPGIHKVHAVDAAGVHPLLLVQASERYTPFETRTRPQELLTAANAVLGQGQLSLAKYLLIVAREDDPGLDVEDVPAFFRHLLERVDWSRDLHFQTQTTIDTLDYSGHGLNQGSKVVIAAAGPKRRELPTQAPSENVTVPLPGVLAFKHEPPAAHDFPLWVRVDDPGFVARSVKNFLWTIFTRSDPAADIHGVDEFIHNKHWGCRGPLIIDARLKPHHAPPLEEDPDVQKRLDALAAPGGPLHTLF